MKKYINSLTIIFLAIAGALVIGFVQPENISNTGNLNPLVNSPANKVSELINSRRHIAPMRSYSLFNNVPKDAKSDVYTNFMSSGATLAINKSELKKILTDKPQNVSLILPKGDNTYFELELTRVNILDKNYKSLDCVTGQLSDDAGRELYYWGTIKGDNNSLASISIFEDFVMGIVSDVSGNYTLGAVKDSKGIFTEDYIFYNDRNKLHPKEFICGDEGREDHFYVNNKNNSNQVTHNGNGKDAYADDTIKVYYETDNKMYVDNGSSQTQVDDYVKGFFASVALIYKNESINFAISRIGHWTTVDPYANMTSSDAILNAFGEAQKDNFMGDLAQFLTTAHNGGDLGGLAWINVLCQQTTNQGGNWVGRFSFANIDNNALPYPTFSWTVEVSTHEMGHNLGSYHTHACHWVMQNGVSIGPLDTCIVTEENSLSNGGCINAPAAFQCYQSNSLLTSGFIMSYCHFCQNQGGGINFINGFGRPFNSMWSQSGDTIRLRVQLANCLQQNLNSSDMPLGFTLMQNYPNPYNPSTSIKFSLQKEGFVTLRVYDVDGRLVGKLLDNAFYSAGESDVMFDASLYNLSSGVYFYKMDVNSAGSSAYSQIRKMVLIK